jgi:hypothetical protein
MKVHQSGDDEKDANKRQPDTDGPDDPSNDHSRWTKKVEAKNGDSHKFRGSWKGKSSNTYVADKAPGPYGDLPYALLGAVSSFVNNDPDLTRQHIITKLGSPFVSCNVHAEPVIGPTLNDTLKAIAYLKMLVDNIRYMDAREVDEFRTHVTSSGLPPMELHTVQGRDQLLETLEFLHQRVTEDKVVPVSEPHPQSNIFIHPRTRKQKRQARRKAKTLLPPIPEENPMLRTRVNKPIAPNSSVQATVTRTSQPPSPNINEPVLASNSYLNVATGGAASDVPVLATAAKPVQRPTIHESNIAVIPEGGLTTTQLQNIDVLLEALVSLLKELDLSPAGDCKGIRSRAITALLQEPSQDAVTQNGVPLECPICYETVQHSDHVVLKCLHQYHYSCIYRLRESPVLANVCPLCKDAIGNHCSRRRIGHPTWTRT